MVLNGAECFLRQLKLADHVELRLMPTRGLDLVLGLRSERRDHLFCLEGLKLYDVGAGLRGGIDQAQRHLQAAVVIDAGLGHYKARQSRANSPLSDQNWLHHAVHPPSTAIT